MKKILSFLLCIALLMGVATVFSSCARDKAEVIDLTGYRVVYESALSGKLVTEVQKFTTTLKKSIGLKTDSTNDSKPADECEILIGETDRAETQTLKEKIEGDGYAYGVVEGKLVVVGTTPLLTSMAIDYFIATYLRQRGSSTNKFIKLFELEVP